ncbi:MAG: DUF4215 domain-containing protein [Candidatus Binatia bacterium]
MKLLSRIRPSGALRALAMTGLLAVMATIGGAATASAGIPASTADDVCPSNANPCNVTSVYDLAPNAVLDFGTRSINVTGAGTFNFGSSSTRIAGGDFTASTTSAFLTGSGSVLLLARRRCTVASPALPCLDINDCDFGACGVRRCSLRSTRSCLANEDCQLGTCNSLKRCSGSPTLVRCSTNADCDYGTCPAQLTCEGRGENPLNCSSNTDCSFGTCSVGTASVLMNGPVAGSSDSPANIVVRAADSVSISKPINLNSSYVDADGGNLSVDARSGSISVTAKINATGGGFSQGGSVELSAGTDITLYDDINVTGGDFDGGSIDLSSDRDITITGSLFANSAVGAGFGGEILIDAGRNLSFSGVSAASKSTMETTGHTDVSNSSGDGGTQELYSGGDLTLGTNTRLIGNGSAPDGTGADMYVEAGGSLAMHGDITAKGTGIDSSGGSVDISADDGSVTAGSTATFDVTGGSGGGGALEIYSFSGSIGFHGGGDASGSSGGSGGGVYLNARQGADLTGDLIAAGSGGDLEVDACRITLSSGASLANAGGRNTLVSHDVMELLAGSAVTAPSGGVNTLRYRNASRPPVVQGTVSPAPTLVLDPNLSDCPLCGNRFVDAGESCDDGNAVNGDGCNANCQNENCIAQTISPGYPAVALCEDGNVCTADVCNATLNGGNCEHPPKTCDDSVACTIDSCDAADGTCLHSASDAMCNDGNTCTDDFCSLAMGCSNTANSGPCDDSNRCTENDVCSSKVCRGTRINGCLFCGDDFINILGGEQCDDGNDVSGDCCSATCRFEAMNSPCEDLQFCTVDDKCNGTGACVSGPPNTCADTDVCTADSCDEDIAACVNAQVPRDTSSCLIAPNAKFQVKNSAKAGKDKLMWQWARGDSFLQPDLGTPDAGTSYTLCVYDNATAASSVRASIDIAPSATLWESREPSGLQYTDRTGSSEGVLKALLKTGDAGNTKVKVTAGGASLVLPAPAGASFFSQEPNVVVQLVGGAGKCWTSEFAPGDTKKNTPALFKAATR